MSDELWLFVDEEVKPEAQNKYKVKLQSPSEYKKGMEYGHTSLFAWAKTWEGRQAHAYEAPWKTGWVFFRHNGRRIGMNWKLTTKGKIIVTKARTVTPKRSPWGV